MKKTAALARTRPPAHVDLTPPSTLSVCSSSYPSLPGGRGRIESAGLEAAADGRVGHRVGLESIGNRHLRREVREALFRINRGSGNERGCIEAFEQRLLAFVVEATGKRHVEIRVPGQRALPVETDAAIVELGQRRGLVER